TPAQPGCSLCNRFRRASHRGGRPTGSRAPPRSLPTARSLHDTGDTWNGGVMTAVTEGTEVVHREPHTAPRDSNPETTDAESTRPRRPLGVQLHPLPGVRWRHESGRRRSRHEGGDARALARRID